MTLVDTRALRVIAETEFADIVTDVLLPGPNEMRILLTEGSYLDVWFSPRERQR